MFEVKYALAGGLKSERQDSWSESLMPRIQLLGELVANAVERNRFELQLKESFKLHDFIQKELEFENFYLRKTPNLNNDNNTFLKDHNFDKSAKWIKKGIEHYIENRNIKLNDLCKSVGLSKTSFYNIYPNFENSKGFDRYKLDLIGFIDYKLLTIFGKLVELIEVSSAENMHKIFAEGCFQNYKYFKCLALLVIEKDDADLILVGKKIDKEFKKVIIKHLNKLTDKKKVTGMKNALISTIYHQSLVSEPNQWRTSIIEISEEFNL